jgi:hypothetical protein
LEENWLVSEEELGKFEWYFSFRLGETLPTKNL